jgi:hypothetical protein
MKREYIQPAMLAVKLQHRTDILTVSNVSTSGLNSSEDLQYDKNGGDQSDAWAKQSNVWDNEW